MKMTEKLNALLADSHVMFTKLHNYHWNIKGPEFFHIHEKTEALYNHFGASYDAIAERILQIGGTPIVTLKQSLEKTRIKEEDKITFDAGHVVKSIVEDFIFLTKEFKQLSEMAGEDSTTQAYADEQVSFLEKEVWMFRSFLS